MIPVNKLQRAHLYCFVDESFTDDRLYEEIKDPALIEKWAGYLENVAETYEQAMVTPEESIPVVESEQSYHDREVGLHERLHGRDPCDCAKQAILARLRTRTAKRTRLVKIRLAEPVRRSEKTA